MTQNLVHTVTQPNYFRAFRNTGSADIKPGYILKHQAVRDECDKATSALDTFVGVSVELMGADGVTRSIQVEGCAAVRAGAAITAGDAVTTDASGRAVTAAPTDAAPQNILGYATTDAAGADDGSDAGSSWVGVEMKHPGQLLMTSNVVADRTALKAIAASARHDGMRMVVLTDHSEWIFRAASTQAEDIADELVQVPAVGTGRWVRFDKAFVMRIPVGFADTDAEAIEVIPAGFVLRLTGLPFWDITTGFTGGSSSAIGISTSLTGYTTKGDLLGGAAGDVAAGLTAGVKAGTLGGELDDHVGFQALLFEAASEIRFDRITSVFTAGAGFACIPVVQAIPAA